MVYGLWCMAYGVGPMVYGLWCMAYGVRLYTPGLCLPAHTWPQGVRRGAIEALAPPVPAVHLGPSERCDVHDAGRIQVSRGKSHPIGQH